MILQMLSVSVDRSTGATIQANAMQIHNSQSREGKKKWWVVQCEGGQRADVRVDHGNVQRGLSGDRQRVHCTGFMGCAQTDLAEAFGLGTGRNQDTVCSLLRSNVLSITVTVA